MCVLNAGGSQRQCLDSCNIRRPFEQTVVTRCTKKNPTYVSVNKVHLFTFKFQLFYIMSIISLFKSVFNNDFVISEKK